MKRKSIIGVIVTFAMICSSMFAYADGFTDMKDSKGNNHWSLPFVNDISSKGLVSGYSDGTFKPNNGVSRVDSMVFLSRLYPADIVKSTYEANKSKWSEKLTANNIPEYAHAAVVFGIENSWFGESYFKEFMDATTKKQKDAMRYEFCVYLVRALKWDSQLSNAAVVKYDDASSILKPAVPYVELLGNKGIIATTGNFNPNKSVTRGEVAKMLSLSYPESQKAIAEGSGNTGNSGNENSGDNDTTVVMPSGVIVEGTILSIENDDSTLLITIKDSRENVQAFTNKSSGVVVALDGKSAKTSELKTGYSVKLYTDGLTVKGIQALSESAPVNGTLRGEIYSVGTSSMKIKTTDGKIVEYPVVKDADITKDGNSSSLTKLTNGDSVTLRLEDSEIITISSTTVKLSLKNAVIKGVTIYSSGRAEIAVTAADGTRYDLEADSSSAIFRNNTRVKTSDIKVGYECDIYTKSNLILDLIMYGETKGQVYTGIVEDANVKNDYFYLKTADGKSTKVIIGNDAEITDYMSKKSRSIYDIVDGESVIITGYDGLNVIEANSIAIY